MKNNEAIETVKEIRAMMEKSSRFLSFSGTSAILIGIYALIGAYLAHGLVSPVTQSPYTNGISTGISIYTLMLLAVVVFVAALATVLLFSYRKAIKNRTSFFNNQMYRTFLNFFLPLSAGGIFCIALILNGNVGVIAPAMLLFYGLSLINASKYTYDNIFWLGCAELLLGLVCAFFPGKGLLFWTIGFGILHVVYGVYFYFNIDRKRKSVEA
ncbi:MAG: hypothetical protein PHO94_07080 [Petrimonas sp.]|nr:hypothetical protein [Petrimonas sp.]